MWSRLAALLATTFAIAEVHADDPADARQRAETLEREGLADGDDAKLVACGQAYLDLANATPDRGDELLYNAAACFESGKSAGAAVQAYELLLKQFVRSRLGPRAIARLGALYGRIGEHRKAAERLEEYAAKYAGEKDAPDALLDAIAYRAAIGDDARQIKDVQMFVRTFGIKAKDRAAEAMWSLVPVLERQGADAAIRHLRDYLRQFGAKPEEREVLAWAKLGELRWRQACPVAPVDGLCMKVTRERALPIAKPAATPGGPLPVRCAIKQWSVRFEPVKRAEPAVKEALAALDNAIAASQVGTPAAKHAGAMARAMLADRVLEELLAVGFPRGLDFMRDRHGSARRFDEWYQQKTKLGAAAGRGYEEVIVLKDPGATVAAAARLGQVSQAFAMDLMTAEIPRDVRTGPHAREKVEAFCDRMIEVSEPLILRAADAFQRCLEKSSQLGVHDAWSRLCVRELGLLRPAESHPMATELAAVPAAVVPPIVVEGPLRARTGAPAALAAAFGKFTAAEQAGWTEPACRGAAKAFGDAAAPYMSGLSFHRCGLAAEAKRAYDAATQQPRAASNLGELAWRAGDAKAAQAQWEAALRADPELFAAHVNLAAVLLGQLRAAPPADPARPRLEAEIRRHLQSALAIEDAAAPHAALALLELEVEPVTRSALVGFHVGEALRRDAKLAVAHVVAGLAAVRRDAWTEAHARFETAVQLDPSSKEAHLDLALVQLRTLRLDEAQKHLALVGPATYDVLVARGIVAYLDAFGGKPDAVDAAYQAAIALDPARPEAHYNLGAFYAGHVAARATTPQATKDALRKAAAAFRRAGTADARQRAEDCDKAIAALP